MSRPTSPRSIGPSWSGGGRRRTGRPTTRRPGSRWRRQPAGKTGFNPDASSSLREGLEETLTAVRQGVLAALLILATIDPIEVSLSVTRRATARVTRWCDGSMRRRWCVAGLLRAEAKFRRVKGHRAMPALLKALEAVVRGHRVESGGHLRVNARRNHTFAPHAQMPPRKREGPRIPRRCPRLPRSSAGSRLRSGRPPLFKPGTNRRRASQTRSYRAPGVGLSNQHIRR
jgi:hypothetical protein